MAIQPLGPRAFLTLASIASLALAACDAAPDKSAPLAHVSAATAATPQTTKPLQKFEISGACGKASLQWFEANYKNPGTGFLSGDTDYSSRFSTKANRCLVIVTSRGNASTVEPGKQGMFVFRDLFDVTESDPLGSLHMFLPGNSVLECQVGGERRKTPQEWEAKARAL